MYTVLLSGGSGKRLWPLSNELRSKQYIKLTNMEGTEESCSMVQRVWRQLENNGMKNKSIITASAGQVEILKSQLGDINIAVEPDRRDTFPAIVLSCAYLITKMCAKREDYVCILPVDPYTEAEYFKTIATLPEVLEQSGSEIALMGTVPNEPSDKFGYLVPGASGNKRWFEVDHFVEKPEQIEAETLLKLGAMWNCGVFCFKINKILDYAKKNYSVSTNYDELYNQYDRLPKRSFDYEILEKENSIVALPFYGYWKDLGTWTSLTEQMKEQKVGNAVVGLTCNNTHVINELDIPVVVLGMQDTVIVASFDGILVSSKKESDTVKDILKDKTVMSRYEERRWGTLKTLDISQNESGFTMFRKIKMFEDMSSSYHYHMQRDEAITVLNGRGEIVIDGTTLSLIPGVSVSIPRRKKHAIRAYSDLEYMEIHIGQKIGDEDINRITFEWNKIWEEQL